MTESTEAPSKKAAPKSHIRFRNALIPIAVVAVSVIIAGAVLRADHMRGKRQRSQLRSEMRSGMSSTMYHVEQYFSRLYSTLTFVRALSGFQALDPGVKQQVSDLFERKTLHHEMLELYIIERGFDGTGRPFLTFESGDELDIERIHSPEREADEYAAQVAMLNEFAEHPELKSLISREIPLCVPDAYGARDSGLIYSVPLYDGEKLSGMVSGMLSIHTLSEELERGNFGTMLVLATPQGDIYGGEDLPPEFEWMVCRALRAGGCGSVFRPLPRAVPSGKMERGLDSRPVGRWATLLVYGLPVQCARPTCKRSRQSPDRWARYRSEASC